MRAWKRLLLPVAILTVVASCGQNLLPHPQKRAASVPVEADVALGATHDLLVVGCEDEVTLAKLVLPVAATAFFVGMGRLDAAIYLPGALAEASIPDCKPIDFSLSDAALSTDAFELETTGNPHAFKAHTKKEGTATFTANAKVGAEVIPVSSTLRAWKVNHVQLAPMCDQPNGGAEVLPGWIPAGGGALFTLALWHDDKKLSGYGYVGVQDPRVTFGDANGNEVSGKLTAQKGPFTLTSADDPTFSLTLTAYDAQDFDSLTLERQSNEVWFVGSRTSIRPVATIGGKVPCVAGFMRTVEIQTPTVCEFRNSSGGTAKFVDDWNAPVELEAMSPGTCTMSVTMEGSTKAASLSIPVFRSFESIPLPEVAYQPSVAINDVWIDSQDEMVAVGFQDDISGAIKSVTMRKTGGQWGPLIAANPPRNLLAVHGVSGAVFAVGTGGQGTRWTGSSWSAFDAGVSQDLNDVWVKSPSEVYAVGKAGTLVRFNGADWTAIDAGVTTDLRALWGDSLGNVYAVGWYSVAKKWDGSALTDLLPPGVTDGGFHVNDIKGNGPSDLWLVSNQDALHFDGANWTRPMTNSDGGVSTFSKVQPMTGGFTYFLAWRGDQPFLDRFDGTRTVPIPIAGYPRAMTAVGNDVFVFTRTAILKYRHDPADVFP